MASGESSSSPSPSPVYDPVSVKVKDVKYRGQDCLLVELLRVEELDADLGDRLSVSYPQHPEESAGTFEVVLDNRIICRRGPNFPAVVTHYVEVMVEQEKLCLYLEKPSPGKWVDVWKSMR